MIDKNYETLKSVKTKNNLAIFQIAPCIWHMWAGNWEQDFDDGKNYQWNCQNAVDFWEKICQKIRVSSKWNLEKHILTIFQNTHSRHLFFSFRNIYEVPMCIKNFYFYYETTIKSVPSLSYQTPPPVLDQNLRFWLQRDKHPPSVLDPNFVDYT